ncbi:MAG: electron transport complex subunit RsxC [Candidatus Omnitrophota bacterium]
MKIFKKINIFFGGVKIADKKLSTQDIPVVDMPLPEKVIIPLIQHVGEPAVPVIEKGMRVKTGQLIAESKGFISANVHASINGTVKEIVRAYHPKIGACGSVIIESDDEDELVPPVILTENEVGKLSIDELLNKIKNAGVVGLGGAAFPTHVKLKIARDKKVDVLIVNAVECEPFITSDYRLMLENCREIVLGLKAAVKITGAEKVFIAIKKDKDKAIKLFEKELKAEDNIKIAKVNKKYPQGAEKQLIKTVLNREVPSGKLPLDIGVTVSNVTTLYAVYEAIYKGKALYEQIVTVSGNGIVNPANLRVRVGTPLRKIVEFCGLKDADKIKVIIGGPMMGTAQSNLEAPIVKGSNCVLVFIDEEIKVFEDNPCIKCARCAEVCPAKILPMRIAQLARRDKIKELDSLNIMDCIECGCCAYVCPAGIPLVELIKLGKNKKRRKK